jgi:hypothetical protein
MFAMMHSVWPDRASNCAGTKPVAQTMSHSGARDVLPPQLQGLHADGPMAKAPALSIEGAYREPECEGDESRRMPRSFDKRHVSLYSPREPQ